MNRRDFSQIAVLCPIQVWAQETVESTIIGVGPFEFPIAGRFTYTKVNGATQIAVAGTDRTYTVVMFRDQTGAEPPERISQFATSVQASWERFARQEKGMVVRQFQRTDLTPGLSVMSMATEFGSRASRQYYVQFAATNGADSAVIFPEGSGSAAKALTELEPLIKRVRMVPR